MGWIGQNGEGGRRGGGRPFPSILKNERNGLTVGPAVTTCLEPTRNPNYQTRPKIRTHQIRQLPRRHRLPRSAKEIRRKSPVNKRRSANGLKARRRLDGAQVTGGLHREFIGGSGTVDGGRKTSLKRRSDFGELQTANIWRLFSENDVG